MKNSVGIPKEEPASIVQPAQVQIQEFETLKKTLNSLKEKIAFLEGKGKDHELALAAREKTLSEIKLEIRQEPIAERENPPPVRPAEKEIMKAEAVPVEEPEEDDKGETACANGDCAYYGQGVPQSYDKALKFYKEAIKKGSARACSCVGRMYEMGIGVIQNFEEAKNYYMKGADLNDGISLFALGKIYEKGLADKTGGLEKAIDYYKKAAAVNNSDAMTKLGYLYENDKNKEKQAEAIKYYIKASDLGNGLAMNFLGLYYFRNQKFQQAVDLFQKSQAKGCARGANNLGMCYEQGKGVKANLDTALKCYQEAAEKKYAQGMVNLGYLYLRKAQEKKSAEFYEKAAFWFRASLTEEPQLRDAMFYLAHLYERGLGVDKDLNDAFSYYSKAAALKHAKAAKKCGDLLYGNQLARKSDPKEVLSYYQLAISLDDPEAMNAMGMIYERGFSNLEKDDAKALELYTRSSEKGYIGAVTNMAMLYLNGGKGVAKDEAKGKQLMETAAAKGEPRAKEYISGHKVPIASPKPLSKEEFEKQKAFGVNKDSPGTSLSVAKREEIRKLAMSRKGDKGADGEEKMESGVIIQGDMKKSQVAGSKNFSVMESHIVRNPKEAAKDPNIAAYEEAY